MTCFFSLIKNALDYDIFVCAFTCVAFVMLGAITFAFSHVKRRSIPWTEQHIDVKNSLIAHSSYSYIRYCICTVAAFTPVLTLYMYCPKHLPAGMMRISLSSFLVAG